jgi:preprotein translocase subunit SecE
MIGKFVSEVQQEFRKIIWPSWRETKLTTIFVLIFAAIMSVYLLIIDQIIFRLLSFIILR